jgi:HSP20 family protein
MSSLMRWSPFRNAMTMSEALDRLFDEAFVMPRDGGLNMPSIDMVENEDNVVVKAELPGFSPENVDVRVEGNLLSLRGEYKQESEKQEGQYHVRERRMNSFNRTIPLPVEVNADKATAEFDNGVLTLTLPKNEEAKPKRISITAKSGNKR